MNRTRTGKNVKRLIVWLLMLTMVFSLLPMAAFADEAVEEPVQEPVQEQSDESAPVEPEEPEEPSVEPEEPSVEPEEPEEPTDVIVIDGDELPEDELDTLAAEEGVISEDAIPDPSTENLPTAATNSIRAVMLDCGRKYFTVVEIEALIDAMVKYGYNQLQLSFGNGGCRFLLDEMTLKFKDSDGTTVTINSDSVKTNIKNGNVQFNGDESTLSQSEMNMIISYAQEKGISIVPMLNMPGHSTAIMNGYSEYQSTKEKTKGNLDVDNLTARNYGYALLSKYVDYFASKGCKYFSFGSDESGFDGNGMTSFVTCCAKIIANAGMRPRAFNDATNVATYPTYVQISYWHQESNSKIPTVLANDGHEMLNTHGRWYYVIKNEQYDSNRENKYWTGKVNRAVTSVELPATKVTGLDDGRWTGLNEYFTADPNNGTVVGSSVGTMFCIWCDASQNAYLTGEQVLSYNENYGALYQLQKLAEHYWPEAIKEPTTPDIPEPGTGEKKTINLTVGQTSDEITVDGDYSAAATGDNYVATVAPNAATVPGKTTYVRTSLNDTSVENKTFYVYDKDTLGTANPTETLMFEDADSGKYYIKNSAGKYIYPYKNWRNSVSLEKSDDGYAVNVTAYDDGYKISYTYRNRTAYLTVASSGELGASSSSSKIYLYKPSTTEPTTQTTFSFTGTGEGTTTANIGGVEYTIKVTAPETTENKTLNFGESFTLPAGAEASVESVGDLVTIADGKVTAGDVAGSAVVTAVTKNGGGKVTARYTYNITISEVDLNGVAPLSVELWITNDWIGETSSPSSLQTHDVAARDVYGEDGRNLGDLVVSPAYKHNDDDPRYYYWKGVVLHDGKKQKPTEESMVDAGDNFHQLRWYAGNWEYFHDNTWKAIKSDDTVIAYYLQKFTVSKEIDTFTRDYGASPHGEQTPNWSGYDGFAGVAFAVVYPDGTLSRTEKEMYQNSELLYTTANPNSAGLVYAKNNSNYVISHITATRGRHTVEYSGSGSGTGGWTKDGEIQWNKITRDDGSKWYDEVTVWNKESGTEPSVLFDGLEVDGKTFELRKDDALLVLIYLEVVYTPDNLNLVYWDDAANTRINPNDIQIVVDSGVTFLDREKGLKGVDPLQAGQITLPDNAYIINSSGETQYISKNIAGINGVAANYRSGIYEYKRAEISEDGKTLTLHYDLKPITGAHEYVVDFGLPVKIEGLLGWFNITNVDTVNYLSVSQYNKVTDSTGSYGTVKIDEASWNNLTYTLDKPLSASAIIPLYANVQGAAQSSTTLKIIPATNVYYEDSFARFDSGKNNAANAVWQSAGTKAEATQALEELGKKQNSYGYDDAYSKNKTTLFSLGSAQYVTLTKEMSAGGDTPTADWPTVSFDFKGTGFEIMSVTDNKAGTIFVKVFDKSGTQERFYMVDNYYGYSYVDGKWVVNPNSTDALYQIPVIKIQDLAYGEHKVVVTAFYDELVDHTGKGSCTFYFDGFRVYNPLNPDNDTANKTYEKDQEGYPQYIKLRDEVIKNGGERVFFIDGAANANVTQYKNGGPKNEVYLAKGQAISFTVTGNNIDTIQIGAKAPKGAAVLNVNDTKIKTLETATEMYYDITAQAKGKQVTITNTGDGILSLTDVKVTFATNATASLAELGEDEAVQAVAMVRALYAAPEVEPVEPFKPDHFEAKWSNNVRQGGRAVLTVKTSADVEQIIINGDIVVSNYKTRTERVGYGRNAERVTYHVFTYMINAQQSAEYSVVAVNEAGLMSEAVAARLTVRPKGPIKDWFDGLFGRWF